MSPEEFLTQELARKLSQHIRGGSLDFMILQILIWSSILASAASAFLAAVENSKKWITAGLAIIPAVAITAESNISFLGRYQYHDEYVLELEALNRRLIIEKADPKEISAQLSALDRQMEQKFPKATVLAKAQADNGNGGSNKQSTPE